ncbi:MFS transporter [Georgenia alba]|uniref:MFS transporter n=1 Tax=Georgenia alba TaxID=2233858 RepID=A0ABW2Q7L4_9MICO
MTADGYRERSSGYYRVTGALFLAGVATFALLYSAQSVYPALQQAFGIAAGQATLALSATMAGLGLALLVVGPVSEFVGRTPLIHLSLLVSAVLAAASAVAPTWPIFLGLRLVEGVTLAGFPAVATAYLREELHPTTQARAAGLYIGGTALGGMVGRLLSGAVADAAGWRWALGVAALVALVCAVAVRLVLPPSRGFVPTRGIGWATLLTMTRRALTDRALLMLYGIGLCGAGAFVAVFNGLAFRLTSPPFGLGLGAASLVFLVYPLGTLGSTVAGRLADQRGRRAVAPLGFLVTVVGLLVTLPGSLPVVVAGAALLTGGFFALHGTASGWVPARAHAGGVSTSQAASLYLVAFYAGAAVLGGAGGLAWSAAGWAGVAGFAGALLVLTGCCVLGLRRIPPLVADGR